jgi:hypothetical protein
MAVVSLPYPFPRVGWTCYHERIVGRSLVLTVLGVGASNVVLHMLFAFGRCDLPLEG